MREAEIGFERRVLRLFDTLLDQAPATRAAWLAREAGDDPTVIDAVWAMVTADGMSAMLPTGPPELAAGIADDPKRTRVGNYRLVGELGRGGMGIVYLGERDDGLFEHRVAIKFVRNTVFSEAALAQFQSERRILARLRHPHIAQIHDGGVADDGGSYIVMEPIHGAAITEHAALHGLALAERLALFFQAAEAIEHAHRNLIVHADIKPSNVVVEEGFGVKLLDFGVARLLDDAQAAHSGAYTPGYASPDRIADRPATISDDVYASGALLRQLTVGVAGGDETLDAIIGKATAHDATARYGTIAEFVADLRRWERHRPVSARPLGRLGRARLFWRRNRVAVLLGTLAVAAVLATLAITTSLWVRAERARAAAETRYAETRAMANYLLSDVDPDLARLPGTLNLRRRLVSSGRTYLQNLEASGPAEPALTLEVAGGYLRLAQIYGLDPSGGLGDLLAARASLGHAQALLRRAAREDPGNPLLLQLQARADLVAASEVFVAPENVSLNDALAAARRAQSRYARYLRQVPDDIDAKLGLWRAQIMPGRIYAYQGRAALIQRTIVPTLANAAMIVRTDRQRAERDFLLNGSYLMLAESSAETDPQTAHRFFDLLARHVSDMQARGVSDVQSDYIQTTALAGLADAEVRLREFGPAITHYRASLRAMDRLLEAGPNGDVSRQRMFVKVKLAAALARSGDAARARALLDEQIAWLLADRGKPGTTAIDNRLLAIALNVATTIEQRGGDATRACAAAGAASRQWALVERTGAAMAIDEASGGPISDARLALRHACRAGKRS